MHCVFCDFFCLFEITLFIYLVNISETSVCGDHKFSQQVHFASILTIRACFNALLNFVHLTQVLIKTVQNIFALQTLATVRVLVFSISHNVPTKVVAME